MDLLKRLLILIAAHIFGSLALVWINSNSELLRQGRLGEWLLAAPLWTWILVGGVFLITISVQATLFWVERSRNPAVHIRSASSGWSRNEKKIDEVEHAEATWDVMVDTGGMSNPTNLNNPASNKVRVPLKPKCTDCGTGLTQEKGWWYRYVWRCPKCGKSTPSSKPKSSVAREVKEVAISKLNS